MKLKLLSNNHLFWDTDVNTINPETQKQAIVERVLERGDWHEIKEIIEYYGREGVIESAKNARWFSEKTMYFIAGYFKLTLSDMRCYTERQSNPIPYL